MNTKENWLTTATAHDPIRIVLWTRIFGQPTVPITSILPMRINVKSIFEEKEIVAYFLDLNAITDEQKQAVVTYISIEFKLPREEVERNLETHGVPILSTGITVSTRDQGVFFSMLPDFERDDEEEF